MILKKCLKKFTLSLDKSLQLLYYIIIESKQTKENKMKEIIKTLNLINIRRTENIMLNDFMYIVKTLAKHGITTDTKEIYKVALTCQVIHDND